MASHVDLESIELYVREKVYPEEMAGDIGRKVNFRRACRKLSIVNCQFLYNSKGLLFLRRNVKGK